MKITGIAFIFLVGLFTVSCNEPQPPKPPSQAEQILQGKYKLRKMVERSGIESKTSASFFLILGDFNSSTKSTTSIKFAWEMNDGTYAFSSLPLEKIRVKFDDKATTPTIKFRWRRYECCNTAQVQKLMDEYVVYALLIVRESDWPIQVNLPLNQ